MWKVYGSERLIDEKLFDKAYTLLCRSLPPSEWRTREDQWALFQNPAYRLYVRQNGEEVNGFMAVWEWENIRYVEHLAIEESMRGQGIGQEILQMYRAQDQRPFVLEVEPVGSTPMAQRRIGFYERLGFFLNTYPYFQPPLQKGQPPLPLQIMSWPHALSEEEFGEVRDYLYKNVYGL